MARCMTSFSSILAQELSSALASDVHAWFERVHRDQARLRDDKQLRLAFAQLPRKLGSCRDLTKVVAPFDVAWTLVDIARASLLLAALEARPSADHVALVEELYRTGSQSEQESLLRALAALPSPERFRELAISACRTNSRDVFTAVAGDNPYPAEHFPELSFNQLVLKALFLGMPIRRIRGLEKRATSELARMASAYESERRAAGRPIGDDVEYLITLCNR